MSSPAGTVYVDILPELKRFGQELRRGVDAEANQFEQMKSGASRVLGDMVGIAAGAGAAIATGLGVSLAKVGIEYNTLEQTSRAAFETILGSADAAAQMMDELREFGRSSPFPRQAFIQATQQLLSFGYEAEEIVPTLDAIQNAVAATGGGGAEILEIANILAIVNSTGKFTAETLNQLGYRGLNAAELIGQGMGKTENEIRDSITNGTLDAREALNILTDQMAVTFDGAAAGVKDTWEGAKDVVKGAWRDLASTLLTPLVDPMGGGGLVDWAAEGGAALRSLIPLVRDELVPWIERGVDAVAPFVEQWTTFVKLPGPGGLLDGVKEFQGEVDGLEPALAAAAGGIAAFSFQSVPLIGALVPPWLPVAAAIAGFVLSTDEGREAVSDLGVAAKDAGAQLFSELGDAVRDITPDLVDLVVAGTDLAKELLPALATAGGAAGEAFTGVLGAGLKVITPGLELLATIIEKIPDPMWEIIGLTYGVHKGLDLMSGMFNKSAGLATGFAQAIGTPGAAGGLDKATLAVSGFMIAAQVVGPVMEDLGVSAEVSGAAMGAMAGMTFGPWGALAGAALGGVAGHFGLLGDAAEEAERRQAEALERAKEELRSYERFVAGIGRDIVDSQGMLTTETIERILSQQGVYDQVIAKLSELGITWDQFTMIVSGRDASIPMHELAEALGITAGQAAALTSTMGTSWESFDQAKQSAIEYAQVMGDVDTVSSLATATWHDAAARLESQNLAAYDAATQLDILKGTYSDAAYAANAHIEAIEKSTGSTEAADHATRHYRDVLANELVGALGISRTEAENLALQILNLGEQRAVPTVELENAVFNQKYLDAMVALQTVGGWKALPKLDMDVGDFWAKVFAVDKKLLDWMTLGEVNGKPIAGPVLTPGVKGDPSTYPQKKFGGPVEGAQGSMVPINAHGGEYVLSADVVERIKQGKPSYGAGGAEATRAGGMPFDVAALHDRMDRLFAAVEKRNGPLVEVGSLVVREETDIDRVAFKLGRKVGLR